MIVNAGAKASLFAPASISQLKQASTTNALVFHKYGNRYFLAGIKLQGSNTVYQLREGRSEAELRAQNVPVREETLLALLQ
jgi:hypothetical protein